MKRILKPLKTLFIVTTLLIFLLVGFGYYEYKETIKNSPIDEIVLDIRGSDHYTPLYEINDTFLDAIVAVEDHRFYEHGGLDVISLGRAVLTNLTDGKLSQGGSTITQQLSKNLFLSHEKTLMRKLKEMFISYELERRYTKKEILELYVNVIYYGDGNTGIYAASQNYFGKAPIALDFDEATLLAGLPQSPSRFALSQNYESAKLRQDQVLTALENFSEQVNTGYYYTE